MRVIDPGHLYELDNLKDAGKTLLRFSKDPALHNGNGYAGVTCQEVIRSLIDRVQTLNNERHWAGNADIIHALRHALAGFEARALIRRVEKEGLAIERLPVADDGHLLLPPTGKDTPND
jgi:hypothetical protein